MIGFRSGLDSRWLFCYGFFLYGNTSFSLLYTKFDNINITQKDTSTDTSKDYTCDEIKSLTSNIDIIVMNVVGGFLL